MKKFITLSLLSLITTSAMAASPEVLRAVLASKELYRLEDVQKVEVVAIYRCPNCYEVKVSDRDKYVKLSTRQNGMSIDSLEVVFVEEGSN